MSPAMWRVILFALDSYPRYTSWLGFPWRKEMIYLIGNFEKELWPEQTSNYHLWAWLFSGNKIPIGFFTLLFYIGKTGSMKRKELKFMKWSRD